MASLPWPNTTNRRMVATAMESSIRKTQSLARYDFGRTQITMASRKRLNYTRYQALASTQSLLTTKSRKRRINTATSFAIARRLMTLNTPMQAAGPGMCSCSYGETYQRYLANEDTRRLELAGVLLWNGFLLPNQPTAQALPPSKPTPEVAKTPVTGG